jgi:hypothetical protein
MNKLQDEYCKFIIFSIILLTLVGCQTIKDAARAQGNEALDAAIEQAKNDGVRVFMAGDPTYDRAKKILDKIIAVSHYNEMENVRLEVIDYSDPVKDFNAFASGGGNMCVYTGLMNDADDDELAYVIGHELAHNAASHGEEHGAFMKAKSVVAKKTEEGYETVFTNVHEQEADRIGIMYTALAGFDPYASSRIWLRKASSNPEQYAFFRTHPADAERANTNQRTAQIVSKYYTKGVINSDAENILANNELFSKIENKESRKAGEGGGFLALLEVVGDALSKHAQTEAELEKQKIRIALVPPDVNWGVGWDVYKGTVNHHGQNVGLNFGISNNQGQFLYNYDNQVQRGELQFDSQNEHGYWFRWRDDYGTGLLNFKEYTDGFLRGNIFIDDGTNLGKLLGDWIGKK